jgi:hypothetical protein
MKNLRIAVVLLLTMAVFASCEKWRDNRTPFAASDNALAETSYTDVFRAVLNAGVYYDGAPSNIDTCATRTIQTTAGDYPVTIRLNYGAENCTGYYNFKKRGIIVAQFLQPISQQNATVNVTLENFYSNDYLVEGNVTIVFLGETDGKSKFSVKVADGKITHPDEDVVTWNAEYVYERVEGENSPQFLWDDVFSITGIAEGKNSNENDFTATVKEPLLFELVCRWANKGVVEVEPSDRKTNSLSYGDGNGCDNQATVTIGKKDYTTTLR